MAEPLNLRNDPITHKSWNFRTKAFDDHSGSTIQTLLDKPVHKLDGLHIFFLPYITELEKDEDLCRDISQSLYIDSFFLSTTAYQSNGFFLSSNNPIKSASFQGTSHCSYSRFLVKEIFPEEKLRGGVHAAKPAHGDRPDASDQLPFQEENNASQIPLEAAPEKVYRYDWQYLSFFSLWFARDDHETKYAGIAPLVDGRAHQLRMGDCESRTTTGTQILLCFDDSEDKIGKTLLKNLQDSSKNEIGKCSFAILDSLVKSLVHNYDTALWGFRDPVRDIEKGRVKFSTETATLIEQDVLVDQNPKNVVIDSYISMHELSRHVIHIHETLGVAQGTLESMEKSYKDHCKQSKGSGGYTVAGHSGEIGAILQFYASFLSNLRIRAQAFDGRLQNEIRLAYNIVSAQQLRETKRLLQESRHDGKDLTRLVAFLSLFFLPGTFVSGFFSMTFFGFVPGDGDAQGTWHSSSRIWMFFAITVPITFIALTIWIRVHYYRGVKLSKAIVLPSFRHSPREARVATWQLPK